MKVEEIPINIQVARALGFQTRDMTKVWLCRGQHIGSPSDDGAFPSPRDAGEHEHRSGGWEIFKPYTYEDDGDWVPCPHYLSDWSVTGPLIEKYQIAINHVLDCFGEDEGWLASSPSEYTDAKGGYLAYAGEFRSLSPRSPLEAVCLLIIALVSRGKLGA